MEEDAQRGVRFIRGLDYGFPAAMMIIEAGPVAVRRDGKTLHIAEDFDEAIDWVMAYGEFEDTRLIGWNDYRIVSATWGEYEAWQESDG